MYENESNAHIDDQLQFTEEDVDAFRHRQMANCALSLLANAYGIFLIRCHSTKEMAIYRWYLFNIVVWAFLLDLCLTVAFQPFLLLPVFGYCTLGIPAWFSRNIVVSGYAPFLLFLELALSCCISLCLAFGYRLLALFGTSTSRMVTALRNKRTKVVSGICTLLVYIVLTAICILLFTIVDAQFPDYRQNFYENNPGVRAVLDAHVCVLIDADDPNIRLVLLIGSVLLCLGVSLLVGIVLAVILTLQRRRKWMSQNTYRIQKQFIVSLVFQIAVPVGSLVLPVAGIILCILFNLSFPKAIESLLIVVCSSHSTLNILLMAICTRPYREATKRLLLFPFRRLLPDSWMSTSKAVPIMAKGPITRTAAVPLRIQRVTPVDTPADEWRVGQRKKSAVIMLGHRQAIGPRE